jgi:hypothetical protein
MYILKKNKEDVLIKVNMLRNRTFAFKRAISKIPTTQIGLNIVESWRGSRHWRKRTLVTHPMLFEHTSLPYQLTTMHTIEVVGGVRSAGER